MSKIIEVKIIRIDTVNASVPGVTLLTYTRLMLLDVNRFVS